MYSRWAGLKSLEFTHSRLVRLVVDDKLFRQRSDFRWALPMHEVHREAFRIVNCDKISSTGCFEFLNLASTRQLTRFLKVCVALDFKRTTQVLLWPFLRVVCWLSQDALERRGLV